MLFQLQLHHPPLVFQHGFIGKYCSLDIFLDQSFQILGLLVLVLALNFQYPNLVFRLVLFLDTGIFVVVGVGGMITACFNKRKAIIVVSLISNIYSRNILFQVSSYSNSCFSCDTRIHRIYRIHLLQQFEILCDKQNRLLVSPKQRGGGGSQYDEALDQQGNNILLGNHRLHLSNFFGRNSNFSIRHKAKFPNLFIRS